MPVTADQVMEALQPVQDPELRRSIVDLGMVRDIDLRGTEPSASGWPSRSPGARCATRSSSG